MFHVKRPPIKPLPSGRRRPKNKVRKIWEQNLYREKGRNFRRIRHGDPVSTQLGVFCPVFGQSNFGLAPGRISDFSPNCQPIAATSYDGLDGTRAKRPASE
jgi:hypothetical protein